VAGGTNPVQQIVLAFVAIPAQMFCEHVEYGNGTNQLGAEYTFDSVGFTSIATTGTAAVLGQDTTLVATRRATILECSGSVGGGVPDQVVGPPPSSIHPTVFRLELQDFAIELEYLVHIHSDPG
jgi:hypothetical protein